MPNFPFAAAVLLTCIVQAGAAQALAQPVPGREMPAYGSNPAAGRYVATADARIYFERYGHGGRPLILLHGGVYGYIDEFKDIIDFFAPHRTVVAIATRGYGRSELGATPFSHRLFADDAAAVIRELGDSGPVDVVGFSQGATTAYLLASHYPVLVRRVVAIAGVLGIYGRPVAVLEQDSHITTELVSQQAPDRVMRQKQIMLNPELWAEMIRRTDQMYGRAAFVTQDEVRAIRAPTLPSRRRPGPEQSAGTHHVHLPAAE